MSAKWDIYLKIFAKKNIVVSIFWNRPPIIENLQKLANVLAKNILKYFTRCSLSKNHFKNKTKQKN
jgi:hypothetical protein